MSKEILNIVDENNRIIGQEAREIIHQSGKRHRGVHIFLFTSESRLVVPVRAKSRKESPNTLDCSVSEHLKTGEDYQEAAVRGIREELGIQDIKLKRLIQFKMNYGPGDNKISELFEGNVDKNTVQMNSDEIDRIIYHSVINVEKLLTQSEITFSRWFKQLFLWYIGKPSDVQVIKDYRNL